MVIFWRFFLSHLLADFTLQFNIVNKLKRQGVYGMILHCLTHFVVSVAFLYSYLGDTWSYYPTGPTLRISLTGLNSATVAWPVWSTRFTLRQNPDLGTSNWTAVTNLVNVVGSENQVTLSPLTGGRLFRLSYP